MSNQKKSNVRCNPFMPMAEEDAPSVDITDYHKENDDFIIEYVEVDHVKSIGDKDTDFVINTTIEVGSKVSRQEYIDSYSDEVGILNILEKVRRTGDVSLLHQVDSPVMPSHDKDALGRPVQDIVDITSYQVDRIDALESFKKGSTSYADLPDDLKGKLSMKDVASLSDAEINDYLDRVKTQIISMRKEKDDESSK